MYKKLAICSLLTALALIIGFVEHLVSLDFIAPGVKLGLANSIVLILLYKSDLKSAALVNLARIMLSSLLFSGIMAGIFSLVGAFLSMITAVLLKKTNLFSIVGVSIAAAVSHSIGQIIAAYFVFHTVSVFYYLPLLCITSVLCGSLIGIISNLITNRTNI